MLRFHLILGFFLLFATQGIAQSPEAIAYFQQSVSLFEQNKSNEALEMLNRAIGDSPQYQEAILMRARHYADKKQFDKSLDDLSTLVQLVPTHIPYLVERGALLQRAKNFDEAETDYLKAYQEDSTNLDVLNALGDLYYEAELSQDALKYLEKAIKIDPKDFEPRYTRAWVYLETKQYDACLEDVRICETLQKDENNLLRLKALCYTRKANYKEAIKTFETLLDKKVKLVEEDFLYWGIAYYEQNAYKDALLYFSLPQKAENPDLYHYLGKTYYKLNDNKKALQKLDSALTLLKSIEGQEYEHSAPVYYNRAIVNHRVGKLKEAEKDLLQALLLTPELIEQKNYKGEPISLLENATNILKISKTTLDETRLKGHQDRAESLILSGETNRAWAELKKCDKLDSLHARNPLLYAKISLLVGKFQDALTYLAKSENLSKGNSAEDIAYLRAIAHQEKGEFAEAKKQIQKAIEKNNKDAAYYSVLGSIEFEAANTKGAVEAINQALIMQPQNMDFYIERAIYQQNLGNFEDAIKDCNKVLADEDNKDNPEALYQRGLAYKALKKYKEALADFQKAELYNSQDEELKALIQEMKSKK